MMAFILATDFDFIAYYEQNGLFFFFFFFKAFFTPLAFLEYGEGHKANQQTELNSQFQWRPRALRSRGQPAMPRGRNATGPF